MSTLSERLAAWFSTLTWETLPPRQRELATLRLLDAFGLMLGGSTSAASAIARRCVAQNAIGSAPGFAALAGGVAAHCFDFDDTFPESVVHPGSAIVPTALAVGAARGADGAEILTAIAGGYEIAARLSGAGGRHFHARGFHATGVFTPIVSAFVAARLMRSKPEAAASAAGLAASMSGGLLAFLEDGSWSKWLHVGWGNLGGVLAADFAGAGFRGPLGALDGRHNLYEAFIGAEIAGPADVETRLGVEWRSESALFKYYPCAHVIHPYIDLVLAVRRSLEPSSVERIVCAVTPWAISIVCEPRDVKIRPRTAMDAIASLPFQVASALVDGRVGLETIAEERLLRPEVVELAARVGYVPDAALEGFAARIDVVTAGGIDVRSGTAAGPDADRLRAKFRDVAGLALPARRVEQAIAAVEAFDRARNADAFVEFLAEAAGPPA
jgi:2-methylcitrate dehydratase PrpD